MKTFVYKLRPSPAQAALFDETLETCRRLYNHALAERKTAYTERGETLAFARQCATLPKLKQTWHHLKRVHAQVNPAGTSQKGKASTLWRAGESERGQPIITIWFDQADCGACAERARCTSSEVRPRILKLRPQAQHEALQAVRQAQATDDFKRRYAKRAGIEGTIAQGTGRFGLRRTPFRGLAKTHLHHILIGIAINLTRFVAWLDDTPRPGPYPRRSRFLALALSCAT